MRIYKRSLAVLATAIAVTIAPAAHADLPALTIELVRQAAAANIPLMVQDIYTIEHRCGVRGFGGGPGGMSMAEQTDIMAEARMRHVIPSTIWLRRNDAVLAKCLPSAPLAN
jgi:hypothetical protein